MWLDYEKDRRTDCGLRPEKGVKTHDASFVGLSRIFVLIPRVREPPGL